MARIDANCAKRGLREIWCELTAYAKNKAVNWHVLFAKINENGLIFMKDKGYKFVEHTADIMAQAWGRDFEQALCEAANAMFDVMGGKEAEGGEEFEVGANAKNLEELVVYFLSEILSESQISGILPKKIKKMEFDRGKMEIKAKIAGGKKRPKDDIKAVTFHELKVEQGKNLCKIQVLFDV
jgi:SHS2 domain-containing protein